MFLDPTFWVAVGFLAFIGILVWQKVPAIIARALDERAEKIRAELDQATKLREDAQALFADYQRKQRDAMKEAEEIVAQARTEAERIKRQAEQELKALIQRRQAQAESKIAQAEQAAIKEVRDAAAELAAGAARRIVEAELKGAKADSLVDRAIAEMREKLH
ncbi:MAG: F0F1 ATP synthase subunit B [Maricaulaceae bacterium]|nr:F0F1 ATP synthase subunit B [Maricaulaceae bacterium]